MFSLWRSIIRAYKLKPLSLANDRLKKLVGTQQPLRKTLPGLKCNAGTYTSFFYVTCWKIQYLMYKHLFACFCFVINCMVLQAQTYKVWPLSNGFGLDFKTEPPNIFNNIANGGRLVAVCDNNGDILFYGDRYFNGWALYNSDNSIIPGSEGIILDGIQNIIIPVPLHPKQFYIFSDGNKIIDQIPHYSFYYSLIDMSGNGIVLTLNHKLTDLHQQSGTGITAVSHSNGTDIWVIVRDHDSLLSFPITANSVGNPIASVLPFGEEFDNLQWSNVYLKASYKNGVLAEYLTASQSRNYPEISASTLHLYSIDRATGKISNSRILEYYYDTSSMFKHLYTDMSFSPNDSFLYLIDWIPGIGRNYQTGATLAQFDMHASDIESSGYDMPLPWSYGIQLGDNNKMYISLTEPYSRNNHAKQYLSLIKYPDRKAPYDILLSHYFYIGDTPNQAWLPNIFRSHIYELGFQYTSACGGLQFTAHGDTAFKTFEWFFDNGDSAVGLNCMHHYPSPGKYFVKVRGRASDGYSAWYSDTVTYNPLPPPKARYTFASQKGCQWVGFQFRDSSVCDSSRLAYRSWLWDFGDGKKDTARNPKHIYTAAGQYRVSLQFSDGICTDTFSSIQDIIILNAPRPGFSVSLKQGCAPLSVKVIDQAAGVVQHRIFTSTNGQSDTNSNVTFLYTKAGDYVIHQYLKGPTGCITEDSVSIHVIQSFADTDGLHLLQVSVDSAGLFIKWKPYEHVYAYDVYRKDDKLDWLLQDEVTDTSYRDLSADYHKNHYQYYIQVVDSCNNISAPGVPSGNILLQAMYKSRQNIQLNWNSYTGWQYGVARYELERKTDSAGKYSILSNSAVSGQTDDGMLLSGQTYACYRIHAFEQAGNHRESYSNEVCINLQPLYWIPSAFTPNKQGPGENETFKVTGFGLRDFELQVMNRSWNVVYDSHDINQGWDGTYKGQPLPEGQYIYVLNAQSNDGFIHKIGSVDLIR